MPTRRAAVSAVAVCLRRNNQGLRRPVQHIYLAAMRTFASEYSATNLTMTDPLSLTVSVVALIGVAHKISSAISYLRKIEHVPARVYVLRNEVTDLEVVLEHAAGTIQQNDLDGQDGAFKATLGDIKRKLAEVSSTIERIGNALERNKTRFIKRNAISAKEMANLETLVIDIRASKESLGFMLGFSTS
jgi:hypothetical protein